MKTDELIENLSGSLAPVSRFALYRRLAEGVGTGAVVSFLFMWMWLGIRLDLANAMTTPAYWMKFAFTLGLAVFALWATEKLARPAARAAIPLAGIGIVFAVLLGAASMQWMKTPPAARMPLLMGHSAPACPWLIVAISLPIFAGRFWSLRALAPTRIVFAGALAGFASGALGAWIYAFHCDESAAPFVLVFYTLGIAALGAAGALIARRLLRW